MRLAPLVRAVAGGCLLAACQTASGVAQTPDEPSAVGAGVRAPAAPSAPAVSPEARALYRRTLVRDAPPSCAALTEGLAAPLAALLEVSERVVMPPWSSVRAATCVLEQHPTDPVAAAHLLSWVRRAETRGLGLLTLDHLDDLEAPLAAQVLEAALQGPLADAVPERVARLSRHAALRERFAPRAVPGATTR